MVDLFTDAVAFAITFLVVMGIISAFLWLVIEMISAGIFALWGLINFTKFLLRSRS